MLKLFNNLKTKLAILVILLLLVILATFSIIQLKTEREHLENELEEKMARVTETIAYTSSDPIWEFNYTSLERNIESFLADSEIISIKIKDNNGEVIASAKEDVNLNSLVATEKIFSETNNQLGLAKVEFTDYYVEEQIAASRNSLLILAIILSLLSTIFIFIISNITLNPIIKLTTLANSMADGNLDIDFPEIKMQNEVGKLAKALNKMHTNIKKMINRLQYQAFHDYLTDLPNRRKFILELRQEIKENNGAVLLLDLDNFKEINDTLGHIYGDKLLKKVGKRLLQLNKEKIFVARYGGDEFLLLVKNKNNIEYLNQFLMKIHSLFKKPFWVNNDKLDIDYSLGIARFPEDGNNTFQLITRADTAMYEAKEKNESHLYYNQEMMNTLREKKRIKSILKEALNKDNFMLKYQPQINLNTGKADYVEGLIRLKNHNLSPGKFIPVAEESNLIIKIGRVVTKKAIEQITTWQKKGLTPKKISINFSPKQLNDSSYIDFLTDSLAKADIPAKLLEIEITESILLKEKQQSLNFLSKLKKTGVSIALDDFGTGYSSLNYLTYIQLDRIKLDKTLINKFLQEDDLKTINSLINLFHNLNLPIVAEGIEEESEYKKLKEKNCDYIQGYLFSKPILPSEIEKLYDKNFIADLD